MFEGSLVSTQEGELTRAAPLFGTFAVAVAFCLSLFVFAQQLRTKDVPARNIPLPVALADAQQHVGSAMQPVSH